MESENIKKLREELEKLENANMFCDWIRSKIATEYVDALKKVYSDPKVFAYRKTYELVDKKIDVINYQLSHIRDCIRVTEKMLDILENDFKEIKEE